jgi:hypothetical protein
MPEKSGSVTRVSALTFVDEVWRPRICAYPHSLAMEAELAAAVVAAVTP